jgi:hypothetical protein
MVSGPLRLARVRDNERFDDGRCSCCDPAVGAPVVHGARTELYPAKPTSNQTNESCSVRAIFYLCTVVSKGKKEKDAANKGMVGRICGTRAGRWREV